MTVTVSPPPHHRYHRRLSSCTRNSTNYVKAAVLVPVSVIASVTPSPHHRHYHGHPGNCSRNGSNHVKAAVIAPVSVTASVTPSAHHRYRRNRHRYHQHGALGVPLLLFPFFFLFTTRQDPDPSIRLRALDLIFQLVSRNNARALVAELLNYLVVASVEQKRDMCSKILQVRVIRVSMKPSISQLMFFIFVREKKKTGARFATMSELKTYYCTWYIYIAGWGFL